MKFHYYLASFNHENFNASLELKPRSGTAKDRDNLYMRLRELEFDVTYFNDLTFNELSSEIMKCKKAFYFYCYRLTHLC